MKRDMELVRKIIVEIENRKDARPSTLAIPDVDDDILARHLEMLLEAGLIEGQKSAPLGPSPPIIMVKDLTWEGHDFASVLGNDTVWAKMKRAFSPSDLATLPLAVIKNAGMSVLEHWAKSKLGL